MSFIRQGAYSLILDDKGLAQNSKHLTEGPILHLKDI